MAQVQRPAEEAHSATGTPPESSGSRDAIHLGTSLFHIFQNKALTAVAIPVPSNPNLALPDIGNLAKWAVSSYKFGFGSECLRDDDPETFWQ